MRHAFRTDSRPTRFPSHYSPALTMAKMHAPRGGTLLQFFSTDDMPRPPAAAVGSAPELQSEVSLI